MGDLQTGKAQPDRGKTTSRSSSRRSRASSRPPTPTNPAETEPSQAHRHADHRRLLADAGGPTRRSTSCRASPYKTLQQLVKAHVQVGRQHAAQHRVGVPRLAASPLTATAWGALKAGARDPPHDALAAQQTTPSAPRGCPRPFGTEAEQRYGAGAARRLQPGVDAELPDRHGRRQVFLGAVAPATRSPLFPPPPIRRASRSRTLTAAGGRGRRLVTHTGRDEGRSPRR